MNVAKSKSVSMYVTFINTDVQDGTSGATSAKHREGTRRGWSQSELPLVAPSVFGFPPQKNCYITESMKAALFTFIPEEIKKGIWCSS